MTDRKKDQDWWEEYFVEGGDWEKNGGRRQTLLFAKQFTKRLTMDPLDRFSLMDVGCGLGDALHHFSTVFPNATLHGLDFSKTAIARCRREFPGLARFERGDISSLEGHFDLIYTSNTLEHFADYDAKARILAAHCKRLCILVPYQEMNNGRALEPDPYAHHQHTFDRCSFNFLMDEKVASAISTYLFTCPGAWGWTLGQAVEQTLKNIVRPWLGRPKASPPRQVFYDIQIAN